MSQQFRVIVLVPFWLAPSRGLRSPRRARRMLGIRAGRFDPRAGAINNMRPMAAALTAAGIATWNIESRRLGHAGGGWPGMYQDVALAADALRPIVRQNPLDLTRVISIGHSARGHLALWLAGAGELPRIATSMRRTRSE